MEVSGTEHRCDKEEDTDSSIDRRAHNLVKDGLTESTDEGEDVANKVKLRFLVALSIRSGANGVRICA